MIPQDKKMTLQEFDGQWLRVDSRNSVPPTLAEVLSDIQYNGYI